jgi:cytochrome b561
MITSLVRCAVSTQTDPARRPWAAWWDGARAFGWTSIALHWATVPAVLAVWFLGDSIAALDGDLATARRGLHMSVALTVWPLLVARVAWRLRVGHPHPDDRTLWVRMLATAVHYGVLLALGLNLLSGPLMAWATGLPLQAWGHIVVAPPAAPWPQVAAIGHRLHVWGGAAVITLIAVHVLGALKQLMFDRGDAFVRMVRPPRGHRGTPPGRSDVDASTAGGSTRR